MTFPEKLKAERARTGLFQSEAAELLGVSKSTIEKWERGIKTPVPVTQEGVLARLKRVRTKKIKP